MLAEPEQSGVPARREQHAVHETPNQIPNNARNHTTQNPAGGIDLSILPPFWGIAGSIAMHQTLCNEKLAGGNLLCDDAFFQPHSHRVASIFPDRFQDVRLYRQLVPAVAESHERAAERNSIDLAANLHQAARPEELHRIPQIT